MSGNSAKRFMIGINVTRGMDVPAFPTVFLSKTLASDLTSNKENSCKSRTALDRRVSSGERNMPQDLSQNLFLSCPSTSDLTSWLQIPTDQQATHTITQHLSECSTCRQHAEQVKSSLASQTSPDQTVALRNPNVDTHSKPVSPQPKPADLSSSKQIGIYRIEEKIGEGACGTLYRAYDERLDRQVAVKVLKGEYQNSPIARERIGEEAKAAAAISHPNLVSIYDVCTSADTSPYLVMEFIEGCTLQEYVKKKGVLPPRQAARWACQVADALAAAHAQGLVHRDVKSSNILLDKKQKRAMLTDFGLALRTSDDLELTPENVIAGTPAYMSPEQITTPDQVGPLTDVYSVGVTLYEMLTGKVPFQGEVRAVLTRVLCEEPVAPRDVEKQIPAELEAICLRAMDKIPEERFETAQALADALRNWLIATSPNAPQPAAQPITQGIPRGFIIGAAVVLVLGVLLMAIFLRPPSAVEHNSAAKPADTEIAPAPSEEVPVELEPQPEPQPTVETTATPSVELPATPSADFAIYLDRASSEYEQMMQHYGLEDTAKVEEYARKTLATSIEGMQLSYSAQLHRYAGEALTELTDLAFTGNRFK